jgi:hypothetical protein
MQPAPAQKAKVDRKGATGRGRVLHLGEPLSRFRLLPEPLRSPRTVFRAPSPPSLRVDGSTARRGSKSLCIKTFAYRLDHEGTSIRRFCILLFELLDGPGPHEVRQRPRARGPARTSAPYAGGSSAPGKGSPAEGDVTSSTFPQAVPGSRAASAMVSCTAARCSRIVANTTLRDRRHPDDRPRGPSASRG